MELTEQIGRLEVETARHDERLSDLERWQKRQNGSLQRLEAKLDKFFMWLVAFMGGVIGSLILLFLQLRG